MPLTLRPTGLGSGIDKDRPTTPLLSASGRSAASTIPAAVPTICAGSMTVNGPTPADRVATLEETKAQFRRTGMPGRRGKSEEMP